MAKTQTAYVCTDCGAEHTQWQGQCSVCGAWNVLSRITLGTKAAPAVGYSGTEAEVLNLGDVRAEAVDRLGTGFGEFDRVLGGGLVPGSVVLIGGEPGAGKSTLLLQVCANLAGRGGVLYVTGEESLQQLALRAERLGLRGGQLQVAAETRAEVIAGLVEDRKPALLVLDSVQVLQLQSVEGTPGSVGQVREAAAYFTRLAKRTGTVAVLVGHVTKEGSLAGPKVLEHMIDCFLMLDSAGGSRFRTLRV